MIDTEPVPSNNKRQLYVLILVLVVASIAMRIAVDLKLEQSSILFIGLPALITILVVKYSTTPKSSYGVVFRVITIFLLLSAILFGEGFVCILFAAPLFYGLAAIIIFIWEYLSNRDNGKRSKLRAIIIIPVVAALAQPVSLWTEPSMQSVESFVNLSKHVSIDALNKTPDVAVDLPAFFNVGFAKPLDVTGDGLNIGDRRYAKFRSSTKGIGTLILEITSVDENSMSFKVIDDNTHMHHWLHWDRIKVELLYLNTGETTIKWTSRYQCVLGPAWYFEPLENYAVDLMNKHLVRAYFN